MVQKSRKSVGKEHLFPRLLDGLPRAVYPVNTVPERQLWRYTLLANDANFFAVGFPAQQRVNHSCWYISTHFCCMRCTFCLITHNCNSSSGATQLQQATCQTLLSLGFHEPNYRSFHPTQRFPLSVLKVYLLACYAEKNQPVYIFNKNFQSQCWVVSSYTAVQSRPR